jgi:hypothetical protein
VSLGVGGVAVTTAVVSNWRANRVPVPSLRVVCFDTRPSRTRRIGPRATPLAAPRGLYSVAGRPEINWQLHDPRRCPALVAMNVTPVDGSGIQLHSPSGRQMSPKAAGIEGLNRVPSSPPTTEQGRRGSCRRPAASACTTTSDSERVGPMFVATTPDHNHVDRTTPKEQYQRLAVDVRSSLVPVSPPVPGPSRARGHNSGQAGRSRRPEPGSYNLAIPGLNPAAPATAAPKSALCRVHEGRLGTEGVNGGTSRSCDCGPHGRHPTSRSAPSTSTGESRTDLSGFQFIAYRPGNGQNPAGVTHHPNATECAPRTPRQAPSSVSSR